MIPSSIEYAEFDKPVYQRGLVIDSQLTDADPQRNLSISKGIGD